MDPLSLRFLDDELEETFQSQLGASGVGSYRIITVGTVVLWVLAAVLFPLGTSVAPATSSAICLTMAGVGVIAFVLGPWAKTLNRQHVLAMVLTAANGLTVLLLMAVTDQVPRFAVAALVLIFLFGFVSGTRFVFALGRTIVILLGFGVIVTVYDDTTNLVVDTFILVAAGAVSLLGLRLLERERRLAWHRELVIDEQAKAIEAERAESERLLLNILPEAVSLRLRRGESPIADDYEEVSVLFADIVGFTERASRMTASEVVLLIDGLFSAFDEMVVQRGVEKIKTIGDAYMVVAGIPEPMDDHADRLVGLGLDMLVRAESLPVFHGLTLRVGVHSGPVTGGVVGSQKFAFDVWGNTVNVAARIEKAGQPGRVHISERTSQLLGARYELEPVELGGLKGLGPMKTYYVT